MARSRRKNPVSSTTCSGMRAGRESWWKTNARRKVRRKNKQLLNNGVEELFFHTYELDNPWAWPKGGKIAFWNHDWEAEGWWPKWKIYRK